MKPWTETEHAAARVAATDAFVGDFDDTVAYIQVPASELKVGDWIMCDPDIAWVVAKVIDHYNGIHVVTSNGFPLFYSRAELVWVDTRRPE